MEDAQKTTKTIPKSECPDGTKLNMLLSVIEKHGLFSSVHVDAIKMDWKEAEFSSHVEESDERR